MRLSADRTMKGMKGGGIVMHILDTQCAVRACPGVRIRWRSICSTMTRSTATGSTAPFGAAGAPVASLLSTTTASKTTTHSRRVTEKAWESPRARGRPVGILLRGPASHNHRNADPGDNDR